MATAADPHLPRPDGATSLAHARAARPLTVLVGSESYLVRAGLAALLSSMDGVRVSSTHLDGDALLAAADTSVDVVVTDLDLPPTGAREGLRIAQALSQRSSHVGLVVLSEEDSAAAALALFADGTTGRAFLVKDRLRAAPDLETAVRAVAAGESWFDPSTASQFARRPDAQRASRLSALSPRELEVLAAIADGKSNGAIAEQLVLTKRAVEKHVGAIFAKLELDEESLVSRRVAATLVYLGQHAG